MREKKVLLIRSGLADGRCELCGKQAELRPYGPNGEKICFECGMKDEKTTSKQFHEIADGQDVIIHDGRRPDHE